MTGREKVTYHLKRMTAEQADAASGTEDWDFDPEKARPILAEQYEVI